MQSHLLLNSSDLEAASCKEDQGASVKGAHARPSVGPLYWRIGGRMRAMAEAGKSRQRGASIAPWFSRIPAIVLFVVSLVAQGQNNDPSIPPSERVSTVMARLAQADVSSVGAAIHEPPTYDLHRAVKDRRVIVQQLEFLLAQFGQVSSDGVCGTPAEVYQLEVSGGDLPYWNSLPNMGVDAAVTCPVRFSSVGRGAVRLSFVNINGDWRLRSVAFGLLRSDGGSRESMVRIVRAFLARFAPEMSEQDAAKYVDAALPR